jgi:hypothetical protein
LFFQAAARARSDAIDLRVAELVVQAVINKRSIVVMPIVNGTGPVGN